MKKLNELYEKYSVILKLLLFLGPLIFGIYKYMGSFISLPEEVTLLKLQREWQRQDSIKNEIHNHKQDSAINIISLWENQDYDSLTFISTKLRKLKTR